MIFWAYYRVELRKSRVLLGFLLFTTESSPILFSDKEYVFLVSKSSSRLFFARTRNYLPSSGKNQEREVGFSAILIFPQFCMSGQILSSFFAILTSFPQCILLTSLQKFKITNLHFWNSAFLFLVVFNIEFYHSFYKHVK